MIFFCQLSLSVPSLASLTVCSSGIFRIRFVISVLIMSSTDLIIDPLSFGKEEKSASASCFCIRAKSGKSPAGTPLSFSTLRNVSAKSVTSSFFFCSLPISSGICARRSANTSAWTWEIFCLKLCFCHISATFANLALLIRSFSFLRVEFLVRECRSEKRSASSALGQGTVFCKVLF